MTKHNGPPKGLVATAPCRGHLSPNPENYYQCEDVLKNNNEDMYSWKEYHEVHRRK